MDNGGGACNSRQSAHKRQIVRSFAPHLSNPALARQERFYFALGLAHVLLVFVLPACAVFYARDWAIRAVSAVVAMVVTAVELFVALVSCCCCEYALGVEAETELDATWWCGLASLLCAVARRTQTSVGVLARGAWLGGVLCVFVATRSSLDDAAD